MGKDVFVVCEGITLYCEAESQPEGWNRSWIRDLDKVVWGYKNN